MNAPPIDLTHLDRQTGGEVALQRQVLQLFAANSIADLDLLRGSSGRSRQEAAHLLVGSARAIGAIEVARLAAELEKGDGDVALLEAAVAEAREFIREYLKPA